jgi:hypothetical protein
VQTTLNGGSFHRSDTLSIAQYGQKERSAMEMEEDDVVLHKQCELNGSLIDGMLRKNQDGKKIWLMIVMDLNANVPDLACRIFGNSIHCVQISISFPEFNVVTGKSVSVAPHIREKLLWVMKKWEDE